jgi:acetylornithine deacetylase/succinyl-diaminopimelate desuccinylase-like protein
MLATLVLALAATAPDYDAEAVRVLRDYLRIDTTNPPGNELAAARFFEKLFASFGVRGEVIDIAPGRANFYARVRGDGTKRPLVLTNHMDVVGAEAKLWRQPPFSGALMDGEIWGRGALDMKTTGVVQAMVLKRLVESRVPLARDVIFLALADEEDGSLGAAHLVDERPELVANAEFALNEGANIELDEARRLRHYAVATMEKSVLWLELSAKGEPGHGSTPRDDDALHRLTRALGRVLAAPHRITVVPAVRAYFAAVDPKLVLERDAERLAAADPFHNALLRNTVAVTAVHAGDKVNVIPARATALLDCRLLPGARKEQFLGWLRATLADDTIAINETLWFETLESPVETELMRGIRAVAAESDPGAKVIPLPLVSTTDSSFFRKLGIVTYGFEPLRLTEAEQDQQHGNDERVSVENVRFALRFQYELVRRLAAR